MSYKILEARIEFKKNSIVAIAVLVDLSSYKPFCDVRSISAKTTPRAGYFTIPQEAQLTNDLLQQVAATGRGTDDPKEVNRSFPGWKKRHVSITQEKSKTQI